MPQLKILNAGAIPSFVDTVVVTETATLALPENAYEGKTIRIINSVDQAPAADVGDFITLTSTSNINGQTKTMQLRYHNADADKSIAVVDAIFSGAWIVTAVNRDGSVADVNTITYAA